MNIRDSIILLGSLTTLGASCLKKELHTSAVYRVECRMETGLHISAQDRYGAVTLVSDTVPPGTVVGIMQVSECSGGHVLPSNFLTQLSITTLDSTGSHEVYSGVHDADWSVVQGAQEQKALLLVIE